MDNKSKSTKQNDSANYQDALYNNLRQDLDNISDQLDNLNNLESKSTSQSTQETQPKPVRTRPNYKAINKSQRHHVMDHKAKVPVKKINNAVKPKQHHHREPLVKPFQESSFRIPKWVDVTLWTVSIIILITAVFGIYMAVRNIFS